MGNCTSQNKVYVTAAAPARANPYAVNNNQTDPDPSTANVNNNKANEEGDFVYHNLEDLADSRSDAVEVPLSKKNDEMGLEYEDDIDPSKVDDVTAKLKEYKLELKAKGVGTRKKKVKNSNLVMKDVKDFGVGLEVEGKGEGITNKGNQELLEEADRRGSRIKIGHSLAGGNEEDDAEFDF